jgi:hypothetical protein
MSNKAEGRTKQNTAAGRLLTFFSPLVESISGKPISAFVQASQPKGGRGGGRAPQGSTERAYQELFDRLDARDNPQGAQGTQGATSRGGAQGTSTATESDDLKNPTAFQDKDRAATDFDKNNPFKNQNTTEDRSFYNDRMSSGRFDINSFRSKVVNNDGVLSTHSFLVTFSQMNWVPLKAIRSEIFPDLTMRCDNAILPTINLLQEQNIRRYGFGPVENVAYGVNVGDFTLQFIVDKEASIIDFFESWMNLIVNRDSFGGANMNNVLGSDKRPYEVAYKDTYACPSVNVFVYDRAQNTVLEYNIYDVFPTGIQSMNLSWGEENSLMKLNVTFSFTDLRIRSKRSNFDNETAVSWAEMLNAEPIAVTTMGDQPLVNVGSVLDSLPSELGPPLVIGGNNRAPRTFGAPTDTAAAPTNAVYEIPATISRDAFGQPLINL